MAQAHSAVLNFINQRGTLRNEMIGCVGNIKDIILYIVAANLIVSSASQCVIYALEIL